MDQFLSSGTGPLSRRSSSHESESSDSTAIELPAPGGRLQAKPSGRTRLRRSRLRLPSKPGKDSATALFQRSSTEPSLSSTSLRDRLATRPASERQLRNLTNLKSSLSSREFRTSEASNDRSPPLQAVEAATTAATGETEALSQSRRGGTVSAAAKVVSNNVQVTNRAITSAVESLTIPESRQASRARDAAGAAGSCGAEGAKRELRSIPKSERMTDFFPRLGFAANTLHPRPSRAVGSRHWRYGDTNSLPKDCESPTPSGVDGGGSDGFSGGDDDEHTQQRSRRRRRRVHKEEDDSRKSRDLMPSWIDGKLARVDPNTGKPQGSRTRDVPCVEDTLQNGERVLDSCTPADHNARPLGLTMDGRNATVSLAHPLSRSEAASKAAAAAEKRAAARTGETSVLCKGESTERQEDSTDQPVASTVLATAENAADLLAADPAFGTATGKTESTNVSHEAAETSRTACRRQRGMSSLLLTHRQSTGGRVAGSGGSGIADAGVDAFRRRALSSMFRTGVEPMDLRMGRVAGSRTGAGVICGEPEGSGNLRRAGGVGVSCMAFDSMGALLAAGGADDVAVYDFDEYVPQISRVRSPSEGGVRAYLQPTHCIQTRRAVSCVKWNPDNEDQARLGKLSAYPRPDRLLGALVLSMPLPEHPQIAVSYMHYDEIEVFDLQTIVPDTAAAPILTLLPGSLASSATGASFARSGSFRGSLMGQGNAAANRASGPKRGLGHLCFVFVSRAGSAGKVTHLVAGGRGGMFRVWRFAPASAKQLAPYLQVQLGAAPRAGGSLPAACQPVRPNVTAVCCLNADVALVGTDSGSLSAYSLHPPKVKAFQSGKVADHLHGWSLRDRRIWRGQPPECLAGNGGTSEAFRVSSIAPCTVYGPGIVVIGLRSGRVVVFDTVSGLALGLTQSDVPSSCVGFCNAGPSGGGGDWSASMLACSHAREGEQELLLLATSARAALDSRRCDGSGRESGLRPGPGWELGEVGGGGFRVEQSAGYDLCLPVTVERAIPGSSAVLLSRDVRGYLCPREQVHLIRSRMVTSAVFIGGEEYSVEAMSGDGRRLVLDRRYCGPRVGARASADAPRGKADAAQSAGVGSLREGLKEGHGRGSGAGECCVSGKLDSGSDSAGLERAAGCDDPRKPLGASFAAKRPRDGSASSTRTIAAATAAAAPSDVVGRQNIGEASSPDHGGGVKGSRQMAEPRGAGIDGTIDALTGQRPWNRSWRPPCVRIFAKLRAIFPDAGEGMTEPLPHPRLSYAWEATAGTGDGEDEDAADHETNVHSDEPPGGRRCGDPVPRWSLLQVVGRASLGFAATSITNHPIMNYFLLGLPDGTIATVLPGGRKRKRAGLDPESSVT